MNEPATKQDKNNTIGDSSVATPHDNPQNNTCEPHNKRNTPQKFCANWEWTAIATVVIAIATACYVVIAYFQFGVMRGTLEEMRINSHQSKDALDSAIDNFRLDQRAWVGVSEISSAPYVENGIKVFAKTGEKIKAEVVIKNTGKTPAFKVKNIISLHYVKAGDKISVDKSGLEELENSNRIMQPGSVGYLETPELGGFPNQADIQNLADKKYFVYVTTFITYEDVFNQSHFTEHCAVLMPNLSSFGLCKTNNNAN